MNYFLPGRQGLYRKHRLTGTAESLIESFIYWTTSTNHGRICYSDEDFAQMTGFGRTAVQRAIRELKSIGFITAKQCGRNLREIKVNHARIDEESLEFYELRTGSESRAPKRERRSSEKRAPEAPKDELPIEDIKKEDKEKKTKGSARGASSLDLIKEMNQKAEELILGEDGLFGDEKAPAWREKLLGWVKDRIDPSRVQITQPRKPTKIVNIPQLTKIANQANKWEKEIAANNGSADLLEAAVVEAIDEATVNGWASVHPEKEFEAIFRKVVKVEDRTRDEVAEYVVESLGGSKFKDYGPMKFAKEKVTGKTLAEAKPQVGYVKSLVSKFGLKVTLSQKIAVLFSRPEVIAGDLLSPDQLRQWKKDRGDL